MQTIEIYPNGDNGINEWGKIGSETYHYQVIDEDKGDAPDGQWLQVGKNGGLSEERMDMETYINVRKVSRIAIFGYGSQTSFDCGFVWWLVSARAYFSGGWLSTKLLSFPCVSYTYPPIYGWNNVEWTGLNGIQSDLNNLILSFIAPNGLGLLDMIRVEDMYIEADVELHNGKDINRHINRGINMAVN